MRGDTRPAWTGTASDADGPYPLSEFVECRLLLRSEAVLVDVVVTVVDLEAQRGDDDCGKWTYTPLPEDVAIAGQYSIELECRARDGGITTFPSRADLRDTLTLDSDLNPPA